MRRAQVSGLAPVPVGTKRLSVCAYRTLILRPSACTLLCPLLFSRSHPTGTLHIQLFSMSVVRGKFNWAGFRLNLTSSFGTERKILTINI